MNKSFMGTLFKNLRRKLRLFYRIKTKHTFGILSKREMIKKSVIGTMSFQKSYIQRNNLIYLIFVVRPMVITLIYLDVTNTIMGTQCDVYVAI